MDRQVRTKYRTMPGLIGFQDSCHIFYEHLVEVELEFSSLASPLWSSMLEIIQFLVYLDQIVSNNWVR